MENRVIKFRVYDKENNRFIHSDWKYGVVSFWDEVSNDFTIKYGILQQFTGKKCHDEKEVYEGDILFYEEETESGDERYYLAVAWIDEWSMFATLHVSEYNKYLSEGIKAIDESMYWTYTIEGVQDYHYAGNIYENPELLTNGK